MIQARSDSRPCDAAPGWPSLTAAWSALSPAGARRRQTKSLTVGSKDFAGAQALSQAYGQALEARSYDITFKDNIGATEIVYPALENGDLDGYADYQGTLLTYLGGTAHRRLGRDLQGAAGQARGHRHRRRASRRRPST